MPKEFILINEWSRSFICSISLVVAFCLYISVPIYAASFNLHELNLHIYISGIRNPLVCGRWDYRHKNGSESFYRYSVLLVLPISSFTLVQLLASCHILWVGAGLTLVTTVLSVFGHDIWISYMPVCFEVCTLVVTPCNVVSGYQRLEGHVNPSGDQAVWFSAVRLQAVHCCFGQQWPQII